MTGTPGPIARAALALPAAAYRLVVRTRNAWFDDPARTLRAPVPVVSVGNLAVGGTGKTPLTAWLAERLAGDGFVPAIVSRGYGGTAGPGPLIVSTGSGPRVDARACGDEPFLLARKLPGTIVVVGADRVEGARAAAAAGATLVLLDDGFQHRRIARDLDVVLLDGRSPFGNGRLLPAGPLREPPASLARADLVVLTRLAPSDTAPGATTAIRSVGFRGPVVRAGHARAGFVASTGTPVAPPHRALVFCGIADPQLFRADVAATGVEPAEFHAFRDHTPYGRALWERLASRARSLGVPMVTTEKDLARLEGRIGHRPDEPAVLALRIETRVWDADALLAAVRAAARRERVS